jgi:hypothetical protein
MSAPGTGVEARSTSSPQAARWLRFRFGAAAWPLPILPAWFLAALAALCLSPLGSAERAAPALAGRLVAVGIPGIGAVSVVGTFHPGGPIHDQPALRISTRPGAVLDPERILVGSTSNFGAPLARADQPPGAILSIDPRGSAPIVVPPAFAAGGGQASALGGRVMLFTANHPTFLNRVHNPGAVTADLAPVVNPSSISINNAFGRIWVASTPASARGAGLESVLDPDGCPLAGAPSRVAGGIFTGELTNRSPQLVLGSMATGALATALLGKSPDGGGRAVFAALLADGSLVQIHVEAGVDGLAPTGTVTPAHAGRPATRAGMVFNWVPNAILYVTDPANNSILALALRADGKTFQVESARRLASVALDLPVDIAPAVAEVASPAFSSNTTVAGDADLYVANRGSGTVVRLKQNGALIAVRKVTLPGSGPLGAGRLNGIAVSSDARSLWITVSGRLPGHAEGALIELPAFGGPDDPAHE